MSFEHIPITPDLLAYIRSVSTIEPELFQRLRAETAADPMARMQITPEQGALMSMLVRLRGARRALEVGVFTGYSSLCVASALPADGQLIACDVSENWTSMARRYWKEAGLDGKIQLHLRPAVETLDELIHERRSGTFDFAFIDADKANYDAYYERALILMRPGGVIAIDNVLWHGQVIEASAQDEDTVALRALNAKLRQDARVFHCLVPIGDGMTLALKK